MKKLSTFLFLIFFSFQTVSWADDIRDFELEGISIGDSLLDYFSESEIKENSHDYYKNKTFTPFEIYKKPFFKDYEFVGGAYKTGDNNYIIHEIKGVIEYPLYIKSCYKKMDEISKEISEILEYVEGVKVKKERDSILYGLEESNESIFSSDEYTFKSGDFIAVECYDYSEKISMIDALQVSINTKEFGDFLLVAYK